MKSRKIKKMMWIVLGSGVVVGLVFIALLLAWSPGQPQPFRAENGEPLAGSLSEKISVEINGTAQGMFIQSKDVRNPVLLFLHGGPGMPEYWLTQRYPTGLEEDFTVVWWEQRGAGLSYRTDLPTETMTAEQFVADTLAVSRYLIERFGQPKIYLMGHSWGSYIGIQAAAQSPELYHAYIGVGQLTHQIESEQLAYAYALEQYRARGDTRMVRKLEAAPPSQTAPLPAEYMALRDAYMHGIGIGTTRDMDSVITGIFLPSWQFREYTLGEKVSLWRGKFYSRSPEFGLWDTMLTADMSQKVPRLELPAYFFHGLYDYTCSYSLAKAYAETLSAPLKGFYTFAESAHSPMFEEPEKMRQILRQDVLTGSNALADE